MTVFYKRSEANKSLWLQQNVMTNAVTVELRIHLTSHITETLRATEIFRYKKIPLYRMLHL